MPNNGLIPRLLWTALTVIVLTLFFNGLLYQYLPNILQSDYFSDKNRQEKSEPRVVQARGNLAEDEKSTIELF